jgi:hypothetical protein
MSEQTVTANHNFIVNGDFSISLQEPWIINDPVKVAIFTEYWGDVPTRHLRLVNEGTAKQTIELADLPEPTAGRADYRLSFWYEATQGAECQVQISSGSSGTRIYDLVPTRLGELECGDESEEPFDLDLQRREYNLDWLSPEETTVTITFISPVNDRPGMSRGLRVTQVMIELVLEDLKLESWTLDGLVQALDKPLRLCFGASGAKAFAFTMKPADDSVWKGTEVGLLVNGQTSDPGKMISTEPSLGSEQAIAQQWLISCADGDEEDIESVLNVRSQYTAPLYSIPVLLGNYRLDVVAVKEADYYPVVNLKQAVSLTVRVESHYTKRPMANCEVTWTLKGSSAEDNIVLLRQPTDGEGEASYTYIPCKDGDYEIVASVDSHYKKEDARYTFKVLALKEDPWLSATFSLDGPPRSWTWGKKTAYPCRGETHMVTLQFPTEHPLADTDLALHWTGDDTPDDLGVTFEPELDALTPIAEQGLTWNMACENRRNSRFEFSVRCSKLLEPSPFQTLELAHNWLTLGDVDEPSRIPVKGGVDFPLEIQILSAVLGVGSASGVEVKWSIDGELVETLSTGEGGWSEYSFKLAEEGTFTVTATAASRYDDQIVEHSFTLKVLGEEPWGQLAKVTLAGRESGTVGLVCVRDDKSVELRVELIGETLLDREIYLDLKSREDLSFVFEPSLDTKRQLTIDGLTWSVRSTSGISARFDLHVRHDGLDDFVLPGLLLSRTLEGEGTLTFDQRTLDHGNTAYPCLGAADHKLRFTPKANSPLTSLQVAAKWAEASSSALNVRLTPEVGVAQTLESGGVEWTLDCSASDTSGELGLSLDFNQVALTYPAVPMSLGHNRVEIGGVRNPGNPNVGKTITLQLKAKSHYTGDEVADGEVKFTHKDISTSKSTANDGWAKFDYLATVRGEDYVIATLQSPYDEPDAFPCHTFEIEVVDESTEEAGPRVSTSTTQTKEG